MFRRLRARYRLKDIEPVSGLSGGRWWLLEQSEDGYRKNDELDYLLHVQDASGGFRADAAAPVPDLLSTATALFVLRCYEVRPLVPTRDFIEAHWLDNGGFGATLWDEEGDVEYLFYGLLALGSL